MAQQPLYIFDLDGTLADHHHRMIHLMDPNDPDRWRKFFAACADDAPIYPVIRTMNRLVDAGAEVRIWTGRSDEVADITARWLDRFTALYIDDLPGLIRMRPAGDHCPDYELKKRWLDELPQRDFDRLVAVFEDRTQVVRMWRENGAPCFQVADGDF